MWITVSHSITSTHMRTWTELFQGPSSVIYYVIKYDYDNLTGHVVCACSTVGGHMHTLATMPWMYSVHIYVWWTKVHGYSIFYLLLSKPHALLPKWSTRSFQRVRLWHTLQYAGPPVCGTLCDTLYGAWDIQNYISTQAYNHAWRHFNFSAQDPPVGGLLCMHIIIYIIHPRLLTAIGMTWWITQFKVIILYLPYIPLWHGM